jgi:hypothetical protein
VDQLRAPVIIGAFRSAQTAIYSEFTMLVLRLMIAAGITILGNAPCAAQRYDPNYPVCLQKWEWGGSSTIYCYYTSWDQCKAAASGQPAMCLLNPYWSNNQATYAGHKAAPTRSR